MWCSSGMAGGGFHDMERVIPLQTPPPLISSQLAATASSSFWESQLRAFEIAFFWGRARANPREKRN